ncbi:hypothetical protein [Porphyrobacter sp. YT40]|uniref:hypothetical protein n=1 Tax=Porphyrobacter sp. YT40 TaxID=2547601 RepID=UPI0011421A16|nr:hypothetical protein [Porphyrobacter sp. YT40]QDH34697.1 hypothetical protein E2E27_10415 [Porphyrobacter sp. YT40]
MIVVKRKAMLLAALCLGLGAPTMAQETRAEAPPVPPTFSTTAERITIPFAPPLGTPLTYRLRFERKRASGDSVVEFDQRLTFATTENGYALTLEALAMSSEGQRFDLTDPQVLGQLPAALRVYFLPMVVELDSAGDMVRMRDWPALQDSLRAMPEAVAKLAGEPVDKGALAVVRSVLDPFINASAEEAPALMIRGWPVVFGYGGLEFVSGRTLEGTTEIDTPLWPDPIPATLQIVTVRMRDGQIYLVQDAKFDDETLRMVMLSLIERIKLRATTKGTAALAEEINSLSITDRIGINIDPVTGLPVTARITRSTSATMPTGPLVNGEITTITRIAP